MDVVQPVAGIENTLSNDIGRMQSRNPFGLVMIEAIACGTPVIAFDNGSVPEVIDEGLTGFVVGSISEAIAALDRVTQLDRGAIRKRFEQRFTVERMAQDYLAAYLPLPRMHRREPKLELVSA